MNIAALPRYKLVVALDSSERADAVLEYALDQASRHERSDLHVVTVPERGEEAMREAHRRLAALSKFDVEAFVSVPTRARRMRVHVRAGDPTEEIVELVHEVEADLLIMGGSISSGRKPRLGAVTEGVLERVPCVVMIVRIPDYGSHPLRDKQCPACVTARASSEGEQWFCLDHSAGADVRAIV